MTADPLALLLDSAQMRELLALCWTARGHDSRTIREAEVLHAWRRTYARAARAHESFMIVSYRLRLAARPRTGECETVILHCRAEMSRESRELDAPKIENIGDVTHVAYRAVSLELRQFPQDAGLPQLARLGDARMRPRSLPHAAYRHLGGPAQLRTEVVSYRPGSRCTLAFFPRRSKGNCDRVPSVYAKTYCEPVGAQVSLRLSQIARTSGASAALTLPAVLALEDCGRTLWMRGIDGVDATNALSPDTLPRALRHVAAGLGILHATVLEDLPARSRAERLDQAERKLHKLTCAGVATHDALRTVVPRCRALLLGDLPAEGRELCHGDAHPGQFLLTADGVALLDFDELVRGDLEQDLASFAVSVDSLRHMKRGSASRELVAAYAQCGTAPRLPHRELLEFHYRLQLIDRAYRDFWRLGPGTAGPAIRRSLLRAAARNAAELEIFP